MAHVYGKPGGYAKDEYVRKSLRTMLVLFVGSAVFMAGIGFVEGFFWHARPATNYCLLAAVVLLALLVWRLVPRFDKFFDRKAKDAANWRAGYTGEAMVANLLESLSDEFHVFHDIHHRDLAGNIDHLVVGPTGVFVLETKNWRGHVEYSSDKTLRCDGVDKTADLKALLQRVYSVHEKIKALSGLDIYVTGVMVFTRASVTPNFEATVALHQDDYLVEKCLLWSSKNRNRTKDEVKTIASDLHALFRRELGGSKTPPF